MKEKVMEHSGATFSASTSFAEPTKVKVIELTFVNAFLIKLPAGEDGFVLIDTGLPSHWATLEKELISAGCLPGKLKLVILTHGDRDHAGNCKKLQEKYNVKIAMHQADYSIVETGFSGKRKRKVKSLKQRIFFLIAGLLGKMQKNKMNINKFEPDIFLKDGQSLKEYGFDGKIIHVPGHTKGSIAVLTKQGNLFVGDTMVNRKHPETATIIENSDELNGSIDKLKKLDIKMVYPGHGKPFLTESFLY